MRKKTSTKFQQFFLRILPIFFLGTLTKCQQAALGRVKITLECAQEQMTLHVQLNESFLPNGRFTDWIIVGTTTRPECRLKGNGEFRYIVQIAVLKDPCATKMTAPGVFQNTLRIASFPGLILSDDLNFEFKCALGLPEVLELRLPQTKASESENNEQIVPVRPSFSTTTTSSSSPRSSSFLITGLGHNVLPSSSANAQQQFPSPQTNLPPQQTQRNKFMANSEIAGEEMSVGNAWTQQNGKATAETEQRRREGGGRIGTEDLQRAQHQQQERKDAAESAVNGDSDDFDVSNQWEERRSNSLSSNLLVVTCGFLALFLVGCVFLAMFHSVKQFRATRRSAAPFSQFDSRRTSPGNSSLSPAGSDGSRERVGTDWRAHTANSDSTAIVTNHSRDQLQLGAMDGSYHTEALNLVPPSVPFPAVPLHSSTNSNELHHPTAHGKDELRRTNSMKAFGGNENGGPLAEVPKLGEKQRKDNETIRGEFNAAACRSITEIYRTAEMKLKSMMQESEGGGNGKPARGGGRGEYSTPKKLEPLKERGNLLISCVNKIRGYGSRKLTEQEILRWRQLIRNDANFQNRVFESVSEEDLMRICELPQYRVLFTKLKWVQIMGCIAEEILDSPDEQNGNGGRQRNDSTETVRRMKPLPALPGPSKYGLNAAAPSQLHKAFNHPNASLKIFVGNVGGVAER
uniref:Uncharacterized protein n=1 Tax=Globodera rostochiensis TaxID=31243 RepID=A0A914HST1_GLORO